MHIDDYFKDMNKEIKETIKSPTIIELCYRDLKQNGIESDQSAYKKNTSRAR